MPARGWKQGTHFLTHPIGWKPSIPLPIVQTVRCSWCAYCYIFPSLSATAPVRKRPGSHSTVFRLNALRVGRFATASMFKHAGFAAACEAALYASFAVFMMVRAGSVSGVSAIALPFAAWGA